MPDYILSPDDTPPVAPCQLSLVATTQPEAQTSPRPPCLVPCEGCGAAVLLGDADGRTLTLDTRVATYTVRCCRCPR